MISLSIFPVFTLISLMILVFYHSWRQGFSSNLWTCNMAFQHFHHSFQCPTNPRWNSKLFYSNWSYLLQINLVFGYNRNSIEMLPQGNKGTGCPLPFHTLRRKHQQWSRLPRLWWWPERSNSSLGAIRPQAVHHQVCLSIWNQKMLEIPEYFSIIIFKLPPSFPLFIFSKSTYRWKCRTISSQLILQLPVFQVIARSHKRCPGWKPFNSI